MKITNKRQIWITWESQRRSVELAKAVNAEIYELTYRGKKIAKHLCLSLKTTLILLKTRPAIVYIQNPSNVLAALACLTNNLLGFKVVVDRHSNFIFSEEDAKYYSKFDILLSNWLSNYSIKKAHLTIVTNKYVKNIVNSKGGKSVILEDKIPKFSIAHRKKLKGNYNVVFPCSFSPDEPIKEVMGAINYLDNNTCIYITGNYLKYDKVLWKRKPENIILTGFLSEEDYVSLLASCNAIIALTKRSHTLLCCAYEAVSLTKPLIISNQAELVEYFYKGREVTQNSEVEIAKAIKKSIVSSKVLKKEILELKKELSDKWNEKFLELTNLIKII